MVGRSVGIATVVLALSGWGVFGINPLTTIGVLSGGGAPAGLRPRSSPASGLHRRRVVHG